MKLTTLTTAVLLAVPGAALAQSTVEDGWLTTRVAEDVDSRLGPRLRFGVNVGWSPLTSVQAPGASRGNEGILAFGLHLRAGVQFSDSVAAYYQASGIVGDTVKVCATGLTLSSHTYDPRGCTNYWVPVHSSSLVFEATVAHKLQLAVGPSVLYGLFGNAPIGSSPFGAGAVARVAGAFAGKEEGPRRRSVSVGLQGQVGFFPGGGQLLALEVFVGYELF